MATRASSTDVLIIGAGPTGLVAAAQLAARHIPCRILDRLPSRDPHSRAVVVQARTLELFAKMGLAEVAVAAGRRGLRGHLYVDGKEAATLDFDALRRSAGAETAYPFVLFLSEAATEALLEDHLRSLGVTVERPVELRAFSQDPAGVTATLQRGDGSREEVRAQYLIGSDGAHSTVRHQAGISFHGAAYPQEFVVADLDVEWPYAPDEAHIFLPRRGIFAVFPMPGTRTQRLLSTGHAKLTPEAPVELPAPTLDEVQAIADRSCPSPIRLSAPTWLARFRLNHRAADRYRVGRVFLAGDAAHIHSPAGGQGMNTGIQDAFNLAWKLALVLHGEARPHLLDSYHDERHPIGQHLLRFTDRWFSLAASQNELALRARRAVLPRLLAFATHGPERQARLFRFLSQLSINYRRSAIVGEDFGDDHWRHGPQAGDRAPDGSLRLPSGEVSTLHRQLTGTSFHLLFFADQQPTAQVRATVGEPTSTLISTHVITRRVDAHALCDPDGSLHRRYGVSHAATYLLRPDGYVAFRAPRIERATVAAGLMRG